MAVAGTHPDTSIPYKIEWGSFAKSFIQKPFLNKNFFKNYSGADIITYPSKEILVKLHFSRGSVRP